MPRNLYLAFGDSVTAGYGATHPSLAFVRQVSDFTQQKGLSKRPIVIARNGWTAKDVWQAAMMVHPNIWEQTNIATIMVGGNDLRKLLRRQYLPIFGGQISPQLIDDRIQAFQFHMDKLCAIIHQFKIPHVVVANIYNPVPNFSLAVDAFEQLNGAIREIAGRYRFALVDVHKTYQNNEADFIEGYRSGRFEDLASPIRRPIHPNNAGHQQIASLMTRQLSSPLSKKKNRLSSLHARSKRNPRSANLRKKRYSTI
jgi:lysophospholipase L1-like esterase